MFTIIRDETFSLLPARRKRSQSGWTSFNAPCCQHNGESADTRGRGGIKENGDGAVSYHCFNCNYKASYQPGRPLSFKFRRLLGWLGADDNTVQRLVVEAMRVRELVAPPITQERIKREVTFAPRQLPAEAKSIMALAAFYQLADWNNVPEDYHHVVAYLAKRDIDLKRYDFYWTPEQQYNLHKRVIIPFYWNNELIGYTSRAVVDDVKPKYHSHYEPNYVFNIDKQIEDAKFVLVVEGPFDAMAIDGIAVLSSECSEEQIDIIESLGKEVIVVPDFDGHIDAKTGRKKWSGYDMIETALDYGWSVSFPIWHEEYKDASEAVENLGKLFVLKSILEGKQSNALKIELMAKKIYNKI